MSRRLVEEARRPPFPRPPGDYLVEVCAVCGRQLGPGLGSPTATGRCPDVEPSGLKHRSAGGIIVRAVLAHPYDQDDVARRMMRENRPGLFVCPEPLERPVDDELRG